MAKREILSLTQWENRVREVFSAAIISSYSSEHLANKTSAHVWEEVNSKTTAGRARYSVYVKGYVSGLVATMRAKVQENLHFCYIIDGEIYTTHHKPQQGMKTTRDRDGADFLHPGVEKGLFWIGSNKRYF